MSTGDAETNSWAPFFSHRRTSVSYDSRPSSSNQMQSADEIEKN